MRNVYKQRNWYVDEYIQIKRIVGRDTIFIVRLSYYSVPVGIDWRNYNKEYEQEYYVLIEIYDGEKQEFRHRICKLEKDIFMKKISELEKLIN